ncbi:DUF4176 domain-containing protein [Fructilactobacillus carniphilus]|uniref:DUF4176 domain-containing protein n=1 Tax=Fructilactobacillus carniphilus TaxID=2940297 RepID=A0ABY5BVP3_9LACO|nr:DUF4176 domain-containing protein [Fructilactobacillus carniphilus]USS90296.1 DUF4176 domain-containing protein [Fructilactobacillus carniphilus]
MNEKLKMLPVGSIVYLNEGNVKMVIVANGQLIANDNNELPTYWDYLGGVFPQGFDPDNMYYFNQNDIDKVIFRGYEDDNSERYAQLIKDWKASHQKEYQVEKGINLQMLRNEASEIADYDEINEE